MCMYICECLCVYLCVYVCVHMRAEREQRARAVHVCECLVWKRAHARARERRSRHVIVHICTNV